MPNYLSNKRPDFKPFTADLGQISAYQFKSDLAGELQVDAGQHPDRLRVGSRGRL